MPRSRVSAQDRRSPGRPTRMPRSQGRRGHGGIPSRPPGIDLTEADWAKRILIRCELVAEMSNRPPLRYLRSHFVCPLPPHCGIRIGSRAWRSQFISWRELCFAMAEAAGFEIDGPGPPVPASFEGSRWSCKNLMRHHGLQGVNIFWEHNRFCYLAVEQEKAVTAAKAVHATLCAMVCKELSSRRVMRVMIVTRRRRRRRRQSTELLWLVSQRITLQYLLG